MKKPDDLIACTQAVFQQAAVLLCEGLGVDSRSVPFFTIRWTPASRGTSFGHCYSTWALEAASILGRDPGDLLGRLCDLAQWNGSAAVEGGYLNLTFSPASLRAVLLQWSALWQDRMPPRELLKDAVPDHAVFLIWYGYHKVWSGLRYLWEGWEDMDAPPICWPKDELDQSVRRAELLLAQYACARREAARELATFFYQFDRQVCGRQVPLPLYRACGTVFLQELQRAV